MTNSARVLLRVLGVATLASCNQSPAGETGIMPKITFPDAPAADDPSVPLDAIDGFPFRVRVCTRAPSGPVPIAGTFQAHVWLPNQGIHRTTPVLPSRHREVQSLAV
jgi:hypothetical protein